TSQFENHVRAIAGLPLGSTRPLGHSVMRNLIGTMPTARGPLSLPGVHWHDYGKSARPGRKLGHLTQVCDTRRESDRAAARLRRLAG
ncbi:MAG: 5-(carboxyamino)imidazole ribonucleotide synthase, partial [Steroidobacteraceae bacterium]